MEQKSDVLYRAEKLYKNSREKFGFLLREVVSNAIHAGLIRLSGDANGSYSPIISIEIKNDEKEIEIRIADNGEGFTGLNRRYFTHLDTVNEQKEKLHLHPKGQGRLAIIYFSDYASYSSVYRDSGGSLRKKCFDYPELTDSLFDIEGSEGSEVADEDIGTTVTLRLFKPQTVGRAKTFFAKYDTGEKLQNWFIEEFFPFFIDNASLTVSASYGGQPFTITKSFVEQNVGCVPFSVTFENGQSIKHDFKMWLLKRAGNPRTKNYIDCFARHLRAELENGKLEYEIDLPEPYDWYLTSDYFDENVDQKGDKIEISPDDIIHIEFSMKLSLDEKFNDQIQKNKRQTNRNVEQAKKKYHSLAAFVEPANQIQGNKIITETDIVSNAIETKGKIEKLYWINPQAESEEIDKLLNSSLQIYVDHRGRVLNKLEELVKKYGDNGEEKNELEDSVHDLFLRRGKSLNDSQNINHLHNLWILDDKYTIFSETFKGFSTKRGQELSDIYLWIDDPNKTKELLILELKSTTHSHNAGDKQEGMVAQIKRYASDFYKDPQKALNWDVEPSKMLYTGIIVARKRDIFKELGSNNLAATFREIPFLESSYSSNDQFAVVRNVASAPEMKPIRIEMYSFEDVLALASSRNAVFLRLLRGEFSINSDEPEIENEGAEE